MICAKSGWNWPGGSGEEDYLKLVNVFSQFCIYFPLEKGGALYLNQLESLLPKDDLCQVWLKLVGSEEEDLLNLSMYFAISYLSPLQKGFGPSFE